MLIGALIILLFGEQLFELACGRQVSFTRGMCASRRAPTLAPRLVIGYTNWAQCDEKIVRAVEQGVNVVVWFSINLAKGKDGKQIINGAIPDLDCVARTVTQLRERNLTTAHLISVGGWNAPLPDTTFSGAQWFQFFDEWNRRVVARPDLEWHGFDGIDWDPEGNDDTENPANHFSEGVMRLIGEMCVLAKRAGYIVSMAPAQSYLDVDTSDFDLSVAHASPYWKPDFKYHGHNLYAYWLTEYGETRLHSGEVVPTFDWVALQLYEGWSLANYRLAVEGVSFKDYLGALVECMNRGWRVEFASDRTLGVQSQTVQVPPTRLVIGVANGWTKGYPPPQKFLFVPPNLVEEAFANLPDDRKPRGFMFWNIADEGRHVDGEEVFMAAGLNAFLHTRS